MIDRQSEGTAIRQKIQHFWTVEERSVIWRKWHLEHKGCKEIAKEMNARPNQITGQLNLLLAAYELHKAGVFADQPLKAPGGKE